MASQNIDPVRLDSAYKYPFLKDSKALVLEINPGFEPKFLEQGKLRVEEALSEKRIGFQKANITSVKYAYLMSYIYARMLASALNSRSALMRYVDAEARRAAEALKEESPESLMKIADELNSGILRTNSQFSISFEKYLENLPKRKEFALPLQDLDKGSITMAENTAVGILRIMIRKEIWKNLPIPVKELPKEVVASSKKIKLPEVKVGPALPSDDKRYAWIDKLLSMPIADVRHRTVNLILAPYLTNVRNMSEGDAAKTIINYIERCKEVEPNTKVNESYIRYQCKYSKSKGMKPLSLSKAKELLGSMVNFDLIERG